MNQKNWIKRTLNIKRSCQIKRNQKSISCRAGNLPHEKITNLYPHKTGVDIQHEE